MKSLWRGWTLVMLMLALWLSSAGVALAQVRTTAVSDTVYRADGTPAGGSVVISWSAFTTANGDSVPAGSTTVTLGSSGALSVALAPNAGSTPMGNYYTAVYHLNDGSTSKEYWVIPTELPGAAPATLAGIRNQVLPTSVAMQTVSKQYVDNAVSQAVFGPLDSSLYVEKSGDTMTGPLVLPGDPTTSLEAADMNYVDTQVSSVASGLGGKVALLPGATQAVQQPAGTELGVNRLNGQLYASQFNSPGGTDGVANALASSDCGVGCSVVIDPESGLGLPSVAQLSSEQQAENQGTGSNAKVFLDPLYQNKAVGESRQVYTTLQDTTVAATTGGSIDAHAQVLTIDALHGGQNQYPQAAEAPPYFKSNYGVTSLVGNYYTQGQHVNASNAVFCWAQGDCLAGAQDITSAGGGIRDPADEGTHQADVITREQDGEFSGTCTTGCTTGSSSVFVTATFGGGTQGDGRYLIDTNPTKVISSGSLTGGTDNPIGFGEADFTGTSFPVSTMLMTAAAALSQPLDIAPGTVTLPIMTSGVPAGFVTNTAAMPSSSGLACVVDPYPLEEGYEFFEVAPYTVVDGTHIQFTLRKVHMSGSVISVGGLCGYGIEQMVDYVSGVRQVFPVVGSMSSTSLLYKDSGGTGIVGAQNETTSGYANYTLTVAAISRASNVVTVTLSGGVPYDLNGLSLTVSGVADSSYNGSYAVTTTSSTTLTYPNVGPDSTSTGGSLQILTGGYALFPMAEVTSVYNPTTKTVDGTIALAPNAVAWAAGDTIEEPHYHGMIVYADQQSIIQYIPRPYEKTSYSGVIYQGEMGPGMNGWRMDNGVPSTEYLGGGGTHHEPGSAFTSAGVWQTNFEADAGTESLIDVHCNLHGCNRWNSAYQLFKLDANGSTDSLTYDPNGHVATWRLYGINYSFSPTAFTAGTINVGTLNATTITGGVSAGAITSGTIAPARLPVFGPSGTTHSVGAVPDPGAVAGSTRYLREDGTWDVPAGGGGGGSPTGTASGDLSGTYPSPTVAAVHATSGTLDGVTIGSTTPSTGSFTKAVVGPTDSSDAVLIDQNFFASRPILERFAGIGLEWGMSNLNFYPNLSIGNNSTVNPPSNGLTVGTSGQFTVDGSGNVVATAFHEVLTTPASSSATCNAGDFTDDANYHYVCVAANTWKRVALSSF